MKKLIIAAMVLGFMGTACIQTGSNTRTAAAAATAQAQTQSDFITQCKTMQANGTLTGEMKTKCEAALAQEGSKTGKATKGEMGGRM